jgi:hypothetical protein
VFFGFGLQTQARAPSHHFISPTLMVRWFHRHLAGHSTAALKACPSVTITPLHH